MLGHHLVENPACGEVNPGDLVPAAEGVLDRKQTQRRELRRVALRDGGIADPEEVSREELLARIAIQKLQVRGSNRARAVALHYLINNGHREISAQTDRRDHCDQRHLGVLRFDCVYL